MLRAQRCGDTRGEIKRGEGTGLASCLSLLSSPSFCSDCTFHPVRSLIEEEALLIANKDASWLLWLGARGNLSPFLTFGHLGLLMPSLSALLLF
ncbi:hypothetical protein FA10DRAFT_71607 [Acaromyces ingoldii]|uniref:Uncharacterized protein n=1 Tax=Acaromyces ingoldii TaxID=215250 RepID=A0A316YQ08_9BASI|nr:hypothetical protein FA10DRAFT_71607 [Acaromyces ingoldii]PWN91620.1 hypothetical protein FA10DRAFT_71607 [Acaromyces ingoldii]